MLQPHSTSLPQQVSSNSTSFPSTNSLTTQQVDQSQSSRQAARAGWAQRRETFTRHSYDRPLLNETNPLFAAEQLRATAQQPLLKPNQVMHFPPTPSPLASSIIPTALSPPSTPCSSSSSAFPFMFDHSPSPTMPNEIELNRRKVVLPKGADSPIENDGNHHLHHHRPPSLPSRPQISLPAYHSTAKMMKPLQPTLLANGDHSKLLRPQLAHQSSSSSSSSPADLQSLAEKGRIGRQSRWLKTSSPLPPPPPPPASSLWAQHQSNPVQKSTSPTPSITIMDDHEGDASMNVRSNSIFSYDSTTIGHGLSDFVAQVHPVRSFSRFTLQGFSRESSPVSMGEPQRPSSQPGRFPLLNVTSDGSNVSTSSSRTHSNGSSSSLSSSCCDCNEDSDEQLSRPFLRSHHHHHHHQHSKHHQTSHRMAFHPQLIATCRSPPSSPESIRSNSVAATGNHSTRTAAAARTATVRPCRSLLCLLDSPLLTGNDHRFHHGRGGGDGGGGRRPLLRRSAATVGNGCSVESSSDGEWSDEAFFQPQLGQSSQERFSSRSSLDQFAQLTSIPKKDLATTTIPTTNTTTSTAAGTITSNAVQRVMGRRQTAAANRKLVGMSNSSGEAAQRLLIETSAEPSFEIDSEVEHAYRPLGSFERSVDSNDVLPADSVNNPGNQQQLQQQQQLLVNSGTIVERSHTVGANLRSMARSIGRFVGGERAEDVFDGNNASPVAANRSLDRSSTFDSLRSLEGRAGAAAATTTTGNSEAVGSVSTSTSATSNLSDQNRTKYSVNGGLQRIRSLNPIRALRPMRSLNPLRSLGAMRTIGRMRSLSAAELREERELGDPPPSSAKLSLLQTQLSGNRNEKDVVNVAHLTATVGGDEARGFIDISIAFDQAARKLLLGVQKVHLKWLQEDAQLQVKMVLLPGRRRKCKTKTRPCVNGCSEFNQQFTWNQIRPEQIPHCAIKYTVDMISCSNIVIGTTTSTGNEFAGAPNTATTTTLTTNTTSKRRFLGEQLLSFVEFRPQLQQRRLTLQLDQICSHICGDAFDSCSALCNNSQTNVLDQQHQPQQQQNSTASGMFDDRHQSKKNAYGKLMSNSAATAVATATATVASNKTLFVPGLLQINGSNAISFGGSLDASRPELLLGLAYNATTGRLQVNVLRGSQLHVRCAAQKPPHSYVKCTLLSCTGQELARGKTSVRRAQPNPVFKQTFAFQVSVLRKKKFVVIID